MSAYELTTTQLQILSDMPNGRVKQILRQLFENLDVEEFVGEHTHGNITDEGAIGSTANLPVVTTTAGVLTVGAYGTGSTQPAAGNHAHGAVTNTGYVGSVANLPLHTGTGGIIEVGAFGASANQFSEGNHAHGNVTNLGKIGTDADKVVVTTTGGALTVKSLGGTGATDIPAGSHTHSYSADSHAHGNVTNDGKVGSTADYVVMTTTAGAVTAKNFGTGATDPAAGNHVHGNVTSDGKIGSTANVPIITGTAGVLQAGAFGTSANQFAEGDHAHTQMTNTTTPVEARAAEYRTVDATANAEMHFTAKTLGTAGEAVTVTFVAPQVPYPDTLEVTVPQDSDIVVQLAGTAAIKASGTCEIHTDNVTENDTITIADITYRFKATPEAAYDVDIGADIATSAGNLAKCIDADTPVGGAYFEVGTVANAYVDATVDTATVTVTAKTAGAAGNSLAFATNDATDLLLTTAPSLAGGADATGTITTIASAVKTAIEAVPAAHALVSVAYRGSSSGAGIVEAETETPLKGGINGTTGNDGQYLISENGVSVSLGASTTADSNWKLLPFCGPESKFTKEHFENPPVACIKATGAVPAGGTGEEDMLKFEHNMFEMHILGGGQTIKVPVLDENGLDIALDETDDEGCEISQGILARSRMAFCPSTDGAFYFKCKFKLEDVSGVDEVAIGFRKAEDYQANLDDYDEMACFNVQAGTINTETILNGTGTVTTDTAEDWSDGEARTCEVHVSAAGAVTYKLDGEAPTTVAAFSFDATEVVVPFFYFLHSATAACYCYLQEWEVGLE